MGTSLVKNRKNGARMDKLTVQEQKFCFEVIASETWNLAEAVRKAYPTCKNAAQYGTKLMQRPRIQAILGKVKREREERTKLTSDKVWEYLHRALFFDPATVYEVGSETGWWRIKSLDKIPLEIRQLIVKIRPISVLAGSGEDSEHVPMMEVQFIDRGKVLEIAAKHCISLPKQQVIHKVALDWDSYYAVQNPNRVIDVEFEKTA